VAHGTRASQNYRSYCFQGAGQPGYRLLGAVVEGRQGSVFFKFTGPAKTVAQNQSAFEKMLSTLNAQ
jgi:hypothetical protein